MNTRKILLFCLNLCFVGSVGSGIQQGPIIFEKLIGDMQHLEYILESENIEHDLQESIEHIIQQTQGWIALIQHNRYVRKHADAELEELSGLLRQCCLPHGDSREIGYRDVKAALPGLIALMISIKQIYDTGWMSDDDDDGYSGRRFFYGAALLFAVGYLLYEPGNT